eukprot:4160230-Pyramimonas_sp.AAC.1
MQAVMEAAAHAAVVSHCPGAAGGSQSTMVRDQYQKSASALESLHMQSTWLKARVFKVLCFSGGSWPRTVRGSQKLGKT